MKSWTPIPGFDGRYEIHPDGRVRLSPSGRTMPNQRSRPGGAVAVHIHQGSGRRCVNLQTLTGQRHFCRLARLLAITFLGPPPTAKHQVNHIDGDKLNDSISNLEWVTNRENQAHAMRLGLSVATPKISANDAEEIRRLWASTDLSQGEIAARFGIARCTVSTIIHNRKWKSVTPAALAAPTARK